MLRNCIVAVLVPSPVGPVTYLPAHSEGTREHSKSRGIMYIPCLNKAACQDPGESLCATRA